MEPKYWSFRASSTLTPAMQAHLWAAFTDLRHAAVPDKEPPASKTWSLSLGRRGLMERDPSAEGEGGGSGSGEDGGYDSNDEAIAQEAATAGPSRNPAAANKRFPRVSPGTLQRQAAHPPAARAAALRFMATLDLILGGGGEIHRDRQDMGVFKSEPNAVSPAEAWGGWGGCEGQACWSPRDTLAELDRASLRTATLTRILPDADGSKDIDRGELMAAAQAVKARCGVPEETDVHPFRLAGLGTMVTIDVGVDDSYKLGKQYDRDSYAFFINLRRPPTNVTGESIIDCFLPQLHTRVPMTPDSILALRAGVQTHYFTKTLEEPKRKPKKKKNKKKKKKPAAAASASAATADGDAEGEHDDGDDDDERADQPEPSSSSSASARPPSFNTVVDPPIAGSSSSSRSTPAPPPPRIVYPVEDENEERILLTIWTDEATIKTIESVAEMVFGPAPPGWSGH